jgi:two-component system, OmpR family, sensor histidine kinase TrcS
MSGRRVHTPEGTTVTATVATGTTDDGHYVDVTVSDDGPGIDPELVPHLFERFVRADKSRSRRAGSFGLGLSIAAPIVESHGGTITVRTDPGTTTFSVRLPTITTDVAAHAKSARGMPFRRIGC